MKTKKRKCAGCEITLSAPYSGTISINAVKVYCETCFNNELKRIEKLKNEKLSLYI